jgi:hypothetical protein
MRQYAVVFAAALFLAADAVPARAELRYTVKIDVTKSAAAATPMAAAIGQLITQIAPEGSLETIYVVGPRGVRAELSKAMGDIPAGTIVLWKPGSPKELLLLNPATKTYTRTAVANAAETMAAAGIRLNPTVSGPADGGAIAGIPTQKWTTKVAVDFAMAASLPPDARAAMAAMQRDGAATGEVWTAAGRFLDYAVIARKTGMADLLGATGLSTTKINGFVMRQHLRAGGHEVRFEVTKISEEAVPASMFEVPAGYTAR